MEVDMVMSVSGQVLPFMWEWGHRNNDNESVNKTQDRKCSEKLWWFQNTPMIRDAHNSLITKQRGQWHIFTSFVCFVLNDTSSVYQSHVYKCPAVITGCGPKRQKSVTRSHSFFVNNRLRLQLWVTYLALYSHKEHIAALADARSNGLRTPSPTLYQPNYEAGLNHASKSGERDCVVGRPQSLLQQSFRWTRKQHVVGTNGCFFRRHCRMSVMKTGI